MMPRGRKNQKIWFSGLCFPALNFRPPSIGLPSYGQKSLSLCSIVLVRTYSVHHKSVRRPDRQKGLIILNKTGYGRIWLKITPSNFATRRGNHPCGRFTWHHVFESRCILHNRSIQGKLFQMLLPVWISKQEANDAISCSPYPNPCWPTSRNCQ